MSLYLGSTRVIPVIRSSKNNILYKNNFSVCPVLSAKDPDPFLTVTSDTDFTLSTYNNEKNWNGTLYYSIDTIDWLIWSGTETIPSKNMKIYLRGRDNSVISGKGTQYRWSFVGATNLKVTGNIENLLDYDMVTQHIHPAMSSNCYSYLFYNCTSLVSAPILPAVILSTNCYQYMFQNCELLILPPELPATTLLNACYQGMFSECSSLISPPKLPATTLKSYCYQNMFRKCSSLKVSLSYDSVLYPYEWRIPSLGTIKSTPGNWSSNMLNATGGAYTSNPNINTTYYTSEKPV